MIELNQDNRAVDPVVKHRVLFRLPDPSEIRAVQVLFDFRHFDLRVFSFHVADILLDQTKQSLLLIGVQFRKKAKGKMGGKILRRAVIIP